MTVSTPRQRLRQSAPPPAMDRAYMHGQRSFHARARGEARRRTANRESTRDRIGIRSGCRRRCVGHPVTPRSRGVQHVYGTQQPV